MTQLLLRPPTAPELQEFHKASYSWISRCQWWFLIDVQSPGIIKRPLCFFQFLFSENTVLSSTQRGHLGRFAVDLIRLKNAPKETDKSPWGTWTGPERSVLPMTKTLGGGCEDLKDLMVWKKLVEILYTVPKHFQDLGKTAEIPG